MKESTPEPETIDFDTLIGHPAKLHLCADHSPNTFQLGSVVFEVVEDENDGYRSSMDKVLIKCKDAPTAGNTLLASVLIRKAPSTIEGSYRSGFEGYELMDLNTGHTWLTFGTDQADDYYPCFTYNWNPVTGNINHPISGSEIDSLINQ